METPDLIEFINMRLNKRGALAQNLCKPYAWGYSVFWEASPEELEHIDANGPAYVLREVAAMRAIVDEYVNGQSHPAVAAFHRALRHLAAIWSEHEDYRAEWRPNA